MSVPAPIVRAPPGPRRRYFGEFALRMVRDRLGFLEEVARTCGDVAQFSIGRERLCLINHPDLIRDVLVTHQRNFHKGRGLERARRLLGNGLLTSEGDVHFRQRRLVQPAFHRQRIAGYGATMASLAALLAALHWSSSAPSSWRARKVKYSDAPEG